MKQHMTQRELIKTRKLIEAGVTDIEEIQTQVFCHADKIKEVLSQYDIEIPKPAPKPKKKVAKKASAVAQAVAKKNKGSVDAIS